MLTRSLLEYNGSQSFSNDSILIQLQAPNVPDLTVIDLPGIVRTRTEGQSENVVAEVDAILDKYMRQPYTIILAVVPLLMWRQSIF